LLLIYLCKQIGEMVRARKRKGAGWYQALLVALWIIGEVVGIFCGMVVTGRGIGAYLFALMGAAAGATAVFVIVHSLTPADGGPRARAARLSSSDARSPTECDPSDRKLSLRVGRSGAWHFRARLRQPIHRRIEDRADR